MSRNVAYALVFVLELECLTLNAFLYLNLVNVFQAWLTLAYLTLAYFTLPLLRSMLRPYQFDVTDLCLRIYVELCVR